MVKDLSIESKLASIMMLKKVFIEFSVDLYYNDLADENECYVVKWNNPITNEHKHFRCKNFSDGLDLLIMFLVKRICNEYYKIQKE